MSNYCYMGANGSDDEITVIEDKSMFVKDGDGNWSPGFQFIDSRTVKAHPFIIEVLIQDSERLWSMDEILAELESEPVNLEVPGRPARTRPAAPHPRSTIGSIFFQAGFA